MSSQALHTYKRQEVLNASPEQLITKVYDFCIQGCMQKDETKVQKSLETLINALNFDYDISNDLYALYEYCQRRARAKKFDEVKTIIADLRETWAEHVAAPKPAKGGSLNLNG